MNEQTIQSQDLFNGKICRWLEAGDEYPRLLLNLVCKILYKSIRIAIHIATVLFLIISMLAFGAIFAYIIACFAR